MTGNLTPSININGVYIMCGLTLLGMGGAALYKFSTTDQGKKVLQQESRPSSSDVTNLFYRKPDHKEADIYLLPNEKKESTDSQTIILTPQEDQVTQSKGAKLKSDKEAFQLAQQQKAAALTSNDIGAKTPEQLRQEQRQKLLLSRRATRPNWKKTISYEAIEEEQAQLKKPTSKDYSEHEGIGKDTSTYPVDLSRTITADRYIDCAVIDQVNSQLEGRVVCQITNDIYGVQGRKVLIPAGSRAIGKHTTLKKVGDQRFNVIWERIIRARDGAHIQLTESYTSDRIGSTGVEGVVNNRNYEKYGGALLTSLVSTAAQVQIASKQGSVASIATQNLGTDLGQVTATMLNESLNIKPYSILPAGTRIKITPTTDIWLKHFDPKHGATFAPTEE